MEIPPEKIEPIMRQGEIKIAGHFVNIEQHKKARLQGGCSSDLEPSQVGLARPVGA